MELVYNLEGGVHRLGEDVVHQDDSAVPGPGHHLPHHPVGVLIPPVLRVDGPQDDGAARPGLYTLVQHAVGGTEQEVVVAQGGLEQGPGGLHLGVEVGPAQIGELDVVEGVDAHLVPLLVHPAHHVPVVLYLGSDEEKGGLHPALRETVQQAGGGGAAGAVVKGEGDQLLSRWNRGARLPLSGLQHCIGLRRRPRRGREHPPGQRKKQQQRGDKCPRPPPPGSSLHPARRLSKILWP